VARTLNATVPIDLSADNIAEFKSAIGGFIEAPGRSRAPAMVTALVAPELVAVSSPEQTQAVRKWARQHGHNISNRGRIPTSIQQAFDQAHAAA
jgi:hypothetical protein